MKNNKTLTLFTIFLAIFMIGIVAFAIPGLMGILGNTILLQWLTFGAQILGAFLVAGFFIFIAMKITK